ncbi:hypothetical protein [Microbacterium sp. 4R-513]|nr:hypothetical protein [Microbacterium sp. 4R-513]
MQDTHGSGLSDLEWMRAPLVASGRELAVVGLRPMTDVPQR